MLLGKFKRTDPPYFVEIFPLAKSEVFGWVIYRGARAYLRMEGVADSEINAQVVANEWLMVELVDKFSADAIFLFESKKHPFFDRTENIPKRDQPYSPLQMVWDNLSKGYPSKFSSPEEEVKWEWKLRGIVSQTASDTNYEYQRTKDGSVIWQRKKTPKDCPWCKASKIYLSSDISDTEDEEFQYMCGCGVSGPRAKSTLQALENWNEFCEKVNAG
jgi:hypothetical protein